ncbi:MAG TPA: guanylate kinase [Deltaproteobacteria bacterium]|nr:guanylate kinase [Deltaproteobacteria bacterium]
MSNKKGRLFVISGPSGVGKTTLIRLFLKEDRLSTFSVSYTTRNKRSHEVHGRDYYFVDSEVFNSMVERDEFLEWQEVYGYKYGTPRKNVLDVLEQGLDIFLDIDVNGALHVKNQCPCACLIFIEPPAKEELQRRLSMRGEREIPKRIKVADKEIEKKHAFEYTIVNKELTEAYEEFKGIIESVRRQAHGKNNC